MTDAWAWTTLAGLGAFHGVNPAMGWLFAVGLGLQRRSRRALLWSLLPIGLGHALSIAFVVVALAALRAALDLRVLQVGAAAVLFAFAVYRLVARHRARGGMQVGAGELTLWSFLMATGHGAGLMLLPVLLEMDIDPAHAAHAYTTLGRSAVTGLGAVAIHTAAMLAVATVIAAVVYEWVGLAFLRRGWVNFDRLWVLALVTAGALLLLAAAS
ncbi:MAG: hypothetical protein ACREMB_22595 [Candidatus Rokuibacteriota bacterium]